MRFELESVAFEEVPAGIRHHVAIVSLVPGDGEDLNYGLVVGDPLEGPYVSIVFDADELRQALNFCDEVTARG